MFSLRTGRFLPLLSAVALVGCKDTIDEKLEPHLPATQAEAGMTTLAVTGVDRWSDVVNRLAPNFKLANGDDALAKVLPVTFKIQDQILDSLGGGLAVGLPGSTRTVKETLTETTGQPRSESRTEEQTEGPGTPPTLGSIDPVGQRTAAALEKINFASDLEEEPFLQYQIANALFQEVNLLNRHVQNAAHRHGFVPYLMRMQVGVTPFARLQPFDVYTRIAFFTRPPKNCEAATSSAGSSTAPNPLILKSPPGLDCSAASRIPYVVPLLVTDNLEATRASRARDVLRQLALALGGTVQNVTLQAELRRLREDLETIGGTSLNSLQSVTRLTDNAIQVRFGAVNDPAVKREFGRSMIVRNYSISLLLLVPRESVENNTAPVASLSAKTEIRNSRTGEILPLRTAALLDRQMARIDERFQLGVPPARRRDIFQGLANAVIRREQPDFCNQLASLVIDSKLDAEQKKLWENIRSRKGAPDDPVPHCATNAINLPPIVTAQNIWADVAGLIASFDFQTASVDLPLVQGLSLPVKQPALLRDDGRAITTQLVGGGGLVPERLEARLAVGLREPRAGTDTLPLAAESIAVGENGRNVVARFPSLAALGIGANLVKSASLVLALRPDERWNVASVSPGNVESSKEDNSKEDYLAFYQATPGAGGPGFKLALPVEHVLTDAGGKASLVLTVSFPKEYPAENVTLGIANAEVTTATATPPTALGKHELNTVLIAGTPGQTAIVKLDLAKLTPQRAVEIKASGIRGGEPSGADAKEAAVFINAAKPAG